MTTIARPTAPLPQSATAAEKVVGFRIMRETEIAPHWWGQPVEIGETGSGSVAEQFCNEQNAVTMNPNREKRQRYVIDPILADEATSADPATAELHRVERTVAGLHAGESTVIHGTTVTAVSLAVAEAVTRYEIATARYDELIARPASSLSPAEFDAVGDAQQVIDKSLEVLADAGMLHLIEVAA